LYRYPGTRVPVPGYPVCPYSASVSDLAEILRTKMTTIHIGSFRIRSKHSIFADVEVLQVTRIPGTGARYPVCHTSRYLGRIQLYAVPGYPGTGYRYNCTRCSAHCNCTGSGMHIAILVAVVCIPRVQFVLDKNTQAQA